MKKTLTVLVVIGLWLVAATVLTQPVPPVVRVVVPRDTSIGTSFPVDIEVSDARGVAGWQWVLQWDPAALEYVDAEHGSYIATPYAPSPLGPDVEPGQVTLGQFSMKDRIGVLARIWLRPLAEGIQQIGLSDVTLTDIDAQVYPDVTVISASVYLGPTPTPACICIYWDGSQVEGCP